MALELRLTDDYDARMSLYGENGVYCLEMADESSFVDFEFDSDNLREVYDAIGEELGLSASPVEFKPNVLGVIEIVVKAD